MKPLTTSLINDLLCVVALEGDDDESFGLTATHMNIDDPNTIDPKYKEDEKLLLDSVVEYMLLHMNDEE